VVGAGWVGRRREVVLLGVFGLLVVLMTGLTTVSTSSSSKTTGCGLGAGLWVGLGCGLGAGLLVGLGCGLG